MRRVQQLGGQRAAGAVVGQGSGVGFGAWVLMLGCIFQVARPFTSLGIHVQGSVHDSVFIQYGNRRFKPLGWTVERRWLHHDAWDGPCLLSGLDDLCPVAYRRLPGPMSLFHQLEQQQGPEPGFSHLRFFQNGPTSTWFVVHYSRQVLYRPTSTEDGCFCTGLIPIRGPPLAQLQGESLTANQTEWMFSCMTHAVGRNSLC